MSEQTRRPRSIGTHNMFDESERAEFVLRAQKAAKNAELVLDSHNEGEFATTTFSAKMRQATAYATLSLALSKLAES